MSKILHLGIILSDYTLLIEFLNTPKKFSEISKKNIVIYKDTQPSGWEPEDNKAKTLGKKYSHAVQQVIQRASNERYWNPRYQKTLPMKIYTH